MKNIAFIDGQNLVASTAHMKDPWRIDLKKFRIFLSEKYKVIKAYYFIGVYDNKQDKLYQFLKKSGYTVVFREHPKNSKGKKKGNVDTDIVFSIMDTVYRKKTEGKIILVSGDGDYKKMVSRLAADRKFRAIMFPSKYWSSLYNTLDDKYKIRLYVAEIRKYLELKR
ncbi:NYN domain-containing protein [Candidatus Saccharibacteria bacterium]|nr:NYN domain-containing protein [Candidatus Saccharibacteria bacterium]